MSTTRFRPSLTPSIQFPSTTALCFCVTADDECRAANAPPTINTHTTRIIFRIKSPPNPAHILSEFPFLINFFDYCSSNPAGNASLNLPADLLVVQLLLQWLFT